MVDCVEALTVCVCVQMAILVHNVNSIVLLECGEPIVLINVIVVSMVKDVMYQRVLAFVNQDLLELLVEKVALHCLMVTHV